MEAELKKRVESILARGGLSTMDVCDVLGALAVAEAVSWCGKHYAEVTFGHYGQNQVGVQLVVPFDAPNRLTDGASAPTLPAAVDALRKRLEDV